MERELVKLRITFFDRYSYWKNLVKDFPSTIIYSKKNVLTHSIKMKQIKGKHYIFNIDHQGIQKERYNTYVYGCMYELKMSKADFCKLKLTYPLSELRVIRVQEFITDNVGKFLKDKIECVNFWVKTYTFNIKKGELDKVFETHSGSSKYTNVCSREMFLNFVNID